MAEKHIAEALELVVLGEATDYRQLKNCAESLYDCNAAILVVIGWAAQ